MTLDDLDATLPNGFHDAEIDRVELDYLNAVAKVHLRLWVAELDGRPETYRSAELRLGGLVYWVVQSPDPRYVRREYLVPHYDSDLIIDIGPLQELRAEKKMDLPPVAPDGAFENWIYVKNWNAFIFVAAQNAGLVWQGEAFVRAED